MLPPEPQLAPRIPEPLPDTMNTFQNIYLMDSDLQSTLNETISTDPTTSYLDKSYESSIYIDDEIETMLENDLGHLDQHKFVSSQEKVPLCLKQPETPELLHSLLYDEWILKLF